MFFIPARIEFLNLEGDSLESVYTLRIEAPEFLLQPVYIGTFDTFYALSKLFENPAALLDFLESEEMDEVVQEVMDNGVRIDGRFYEASEFQED